jgi:hypothetical protein
MKIKIENLKFQCHLQGNARVQPAPATLGVNGHGITLTIFHLFSHPYTFHPAHPTLASQPPPLTFQATSLIQDHTLASLIKIKMEN